MKRYATLKDVAKLAGTTAATVSYVLNEKEGRYISDETRRKVLEAAEQLEYVKSIGASSLKGKSRKLIAILIPQFENQFFTRIVVASEEVFVKHGYDLIICNTFDKPEREKAILNRMIQQRVDGIILTPTKMGTENTKLLRKVGMKMVVVDRPLPGVKDFFWVATNNYGCGFVGAHYLFSKGHKRVAYIGWNSGIEDLEARKRAFFDAADTYGISQDSLIVAEGGFSAEEGCRLTSFVLEKHPEVTAIFYGFNIQALGGVTCLSQRGISIPEELSVMIIGSPEWIMAGKNDFTHVDMNDLELGRKAANLLLSQIQAEGDVPFQHIIQDCSLIEGSSVRDIH
ncbi:HTH-type transcriptional repressor PurR [bioreactor metagenome]|uniref:HTH-type transcriptional repressor PurR n=1 Tax=bioreactor metagenome TaxID=1076179 RepID=A0A645APG9_9ZZZZ|nr:LacI family DNA-binding transcriptional regulator [Sphaerochaeta sp.]